MGTGWHYFAGLSPISSQRWQKQTSFSASPLPPPAAALLMVVAGGLALLRRLLPNQQEPALIEADVAFGIAAALSPISSQR